MFVSLITFIIYAASFGWIVVSPETWAAGFVLGFVATLLFCMWYLPKRFIPFVPYLLVTEVFVVGSWLFLLMVDRTALLWLILALSMCLAIWWRQVFVYYHEREHYRVLAIPRAAQWFLPVASFVFMSGLWGLEAFYGASGIQLLGFVVAGWYVLGWGGAWFAKREFRDVWVVFLVFFACFIELSYLLYYLPLTIFVKGALDTLLFIAANRALSSDLGQGKAVRKLVQEIVGAAVIILIILLTARWRS